jgi:hypothetical protein
VTIQLLITNTTLLSLVQVVQVSELLLDLVKLDIKQPVFLNYSQLDPTLLPLKEVLMLLLETCTRMTGDGIFMILLKEVIGLVIKMPFNT